MVKDDTNGELRFLTGTSTVNQLISQQQDLLEQLRPNSGNNNNIRPIIIDLNGDNTQTTSPTVTSGNGNNGVLGAVASQTSPIGALLPQIVGQAVGGGGNGASSPTSSSSPSSTSPTSATSNRRRIVRRGNKRRRVNNNSNNRRRRRRRPSKKNSKKQFVVVRPQRG